MPKEDTFRAWQAAVPPSFLFAVKASRFITHVKKLKEAGAPLTNFLHRAKILGKNLGPILFQLPPNFGCDLNRFKDFLALLPPDLIYAFEFRDKRWFNSEVYGLMAARGLGFCIHDFAGLSCPSVVTARVVYLRFHGTAAKYSGKYSSFQLASWAEKIVELVKEGREVYAYFNNDAFGYAVENAKELKAMVERA